MHDIIIELAAKEAREVNKIPSKCLRAFNVGNYFRYFYGELRGAYNGTHRKGRAYAQLVYSEHLALIWQKLPMSAAQIECEIERYGEMISRFTFDMVGVKGKTAKKYKLGIEEAQRRISALKEKLDSMK